MNEKQIEAYLVKQVKKLGGIAYKFVSPGHNGVPDRLVCLPEGIAAFLELKTPGKKSTMQQLREQNYLLQLGCRVFADVDSKAAVDGVLASLRSEA